MKFQLMNWPGLSMTLSLRNFEFQLRIFSGQTEEYHEKRESMQARGRQIFQKSRLQFKVLGAGSVTALSSRLRTHNYEVTWRYVLGACDLIHILYVRKETVINILRILGAKLKKYIFFMATNFLESSNLRYVLFSQRSLRSFTFEF